MKKFIPLALALLLVAAAAAQAETLKHTVKVATVKGMVRWSQCAFGPDGILHVIFEEDSQTSTGHPIWYVQYDGTTASTPLELTAPLGSSFKGLRPNLTVSPKGIIGVVWGGTPGALICLRLYDPSSKTWGDIVTIADGYGYDEPEVAIDQDGNIHIVWYNLDGGRVYAKSRINGVWESISYLTPGGVRANQDSLVCTPQGQAWVIWREKTGSGEYKLRYSRRTATTPWRAEKDVNDSGASASHPNMALSRTGVPWIACGDIDMADESGQEEFVYKLDEQDNPRERALVFKTQHYPRITVDTFGVVHVAAQLGGGDYGSGFVYNNNKSGEWLAENEEFFASSMDKLPGISSDDFGNVAVCVSNWIADVQSDIWVKSIDPITPKKFLPPVNVSSSIKISNAHKAAKAVFSFAWSANPENNDQYINGYRIYKKEGSGNWELVTTLAKGTTSAQLTYNDLNAKRAFAITTISLGGVDSDKVYF